MPRNRREKRGKEDRECDGSTALGGEWGTTAKNMSLTLLEQKKDKEKTMVTITMANLTRQERYLEENMNVIFYKCG